MENSPQNTKVTLRQQKIKGGKSSLYLDFYPPIINHQTGKPTRRQFLNLYIFTTPKDKAEKNHNKETLDQGTRARFDKEHELKNYVPPATTQAYRLLDFVAKCAEQSDIALKTRDTRMHMRNYLLTFLQEQGLEDIKLHELSVKLCHQFRDFLLNLTYSNRSLRYSLSQNSKSVYFASLITILRQAFEQELISENIVARLKPIPMEDTTREFLTLDELRALAKNFHSPKEIHNTIRTAALFSALTGLRFSDIQKMTWAEVREENEGYSLRFKQQKTQSNLIHPISGSAYKLLGERKADTESVFNLPQYGGLINKSIKQWLKTVGITKKITFHCFRHTFATLQLEAGTDLYTVSKMLGHSNIQTTQIYAKVVDKSKREAANRIELNI